MAKISRFEELKSWQLSRELAKNVFLLTQKVSFSRDFSLKDQINRASGSIMDNIAEGFGRGGNKEFVNFLLYARGSALEVHSQLYRALDRNHISELEFNDTYTACSEIIKSITSLTNYLKNSDYQDYRKKTSINKNQLIYESLNKEQNQI